jgi:cytoskeletal protein RodZ
MSKSNYSYEETSTPKQNAKLEIWDMLSIVTLLLTFCIGVYFVTIFLFPQSALNPLKPSLIDPNAPPTPTLTPIQLDATWTVTPSQVATATQTLLPTYTLEPSATPFSLVTPTITFTPTATPKAPFSATITYIASTIIHQEAACNWQGIGGTVVDANNADMLRMTVSLAGFYNGKTKNELTVSSIAPAYGKSGFEFFLGTVPISSKGELYLQLLDQAGLPLSGAIYIDTFNDCSKNLVLVRFKKNP